MGLRPKMVRLGLGLVGLAIAGWLAGLIVFAETIPTAVEDDETRTDAIVVLTGGSERLATGLALLSKGMADRLFVSGVHRGVEVTDLLRVAHAEHAHLAAKVTLGHEADDTVGNAVETARWVKAEGIGSIRLVTSAYHLHRSLWEFHCALPDTRIIAHPVYPDAFKRHHWWMSWATTSLLVSEYSKYGAARIRFLLRKGEPS